MLTADTKVEAIAAWKFSTFDNSSTNGKNYHGTQASHSTSRSQRTNELTMVLNCLEPRLSPQQQERN